jgi:hypothetical protein
MPTPYDEEPVESCPTCGQPIAEPLGEIELAE